MTALFTLSPEAVDTVDADSKQTILARLADRFRLLRGGRRGLERPQTLAAAVLLMTMSTSRNWSTMPSNRMASPCMVLASSWARE